MYIGKGRNPASYVLRLLRAVREECILVNLKKNQIFEPVSGTCKERVKLFSCRRAISQFFLKGMRTSKNYFKSQVCQH